MPNIDYNKLVQNMLKAAKGIIKKHWDETKPYAEKEFKAFTENIKLIAELKHLNKITEEQAKLYVEIQRNSMRIVLLTIKGLGILAVEGAINAALNVIRTTVNKAIGWTIL